MEEIQEERPLTPGTAGERKALRGPLLVYLLASLVIAFLGIGSTEVVTMEGIIADGARHMGRTGEVWVPRLHGELYSYKPPLANWLVWASFEAFGESAWSLRLPFAASGVLMGLAILLLSAPLIGPRAALVAGLASVSNALAVQKAQLAEWDLLLTCGVGVAVAAAARNLCTERPRTGIWLLGYLALAAAFLAKGPIAVALYAPGLLLAALAARRLRTLWCPGHLMAAGLGLVVVGVWMLLAWQAEGAALFVQPLEEAADKGTHWTLRAVGTTLAKPLLVLGVFLPWSAFLWLLWRRWTHLPTISRRLALVSAAFAAGAVLVLMGFSAYESRYFLPVGAALALLSGVAAQSVRARGRALAATIAVALLFALVQRAGIQPHRAASRSLRHVAEAFQPHFAADQAPVWTPPVSKHFKHSSLFFYLRRAVRTVVPDGPLPSEGDLVVFFSNELQALPDLPALELELVESREQRGYSFHLARVVPAGGGVSIREASFLGSSGTAP